MTPIIVFVVPCITLVVAEIVFEVKLWMVIVFPPTKVISGASISTCVSPLSVILGPFISTCVVPLSVISGPFIFTCVVPSSVISGPFISTCVLPSSLRLPVLIVTSG